MFKATALATSSQTLLVYTPTSARNIGGRNMQKIVLLYGTAIDDAYFFYKRLNLKYGYQGLGSHL